MSRMPRYAAKADNNQPEITQAFLDGGASVYHLKVPVDLMVGYAGQTVLVEVKNLETRYGRKGANERQGNFMATWKGGAVALVDGPEAARRLMKLMEAKCNS